MVTKDTLISFSSESLSNITHLYCLSTAVGDLKVAAILYFACAVIVLFLCVVTLIFLVKMVSSCWR